MITDRFCPQRNEFRAAVRGNLDYESGVIYNYGKNGEVVSVEILDPYGVFAEA